MRTTILLTVLLLALTGAAWAADSVGTVIVQNGEATIDRPGQSETLPVIHGADVLAGDTLTTATGGNAKVLLVGELVVYIGAQTSVTFETASFDPRLRYHRGQFRLNQGVVRLMARHEPKTTNDVGLKTPLAAIHVPGGYFVAEHRGDTTTVVTLAGQINVRAERDKNAMQVWVKPDQIVTVAAGQTPTVPEAVDEQTLARLLDASEVPSAYAAETRRGKRGQIVDHALGLSPVRGLLDDQGMAGAMEGEMGAEFDAFRVNFSDDPFREEDLPGRLRNKDPDTIYPPGVSDDWPVYEMRMPQNLMPRRPPAKK
ncbi:MAG TPA: FecR domain-containing protein [bacterium]|nr:FecR domain-containing protein [bacterium]